MLTNLIYLHREKMIYKYDFSIKSIFYFIKYVTNIGIRVINGNLTQDYPEIIIHPKNTTYQKSCEFYII